MKQLAETVYVDGRRYVRGSTPPVEDAKRITNPMAWEDGEVPDFEGAEDDETTTPGGSTAPPLGATGVMGGDKAIPVGDQPNGDPDGTGNTVAPAAVTTEDDGTGNTVAPAAVTTEAEVPAGNAAADKWRTYAVESGQATAEDVADMSRDELRGKYAPKA